MRVQWEESPPTILNRGLARKGDCLILSAFPDFFLFQITHRHSYLFCPTEGKKKMCAYLHLPVHHFDMLNLWFHRCLWHRWYPRAARKALSQRPIWLSWPLNMLSRWGYHGGPSTGTGTWDASRLDLALPHGLTHSLIPLLPSYSCTDSLFSSMIHSWHC